MCAYDLTHGMLSDVLALPPANEAGQERRLVRALRSPKQAAWLAFTKVSECGESAWVSVGRDGPANQP